MRRATAAHGLLNSRPGGCEGGCPGPGQMLGRSRCPTTAASASPGRPPPLYLKHPFILLGADVHPFEGQRRRLRSALGRLRLLGGHHAVSRAAGGGVCAAVRAAGQGLAHLSARARAEEGGGCGRPGERLVPPPRREGLGGAGRPRGTWGELSEAPAARRVQALALRALLRKVVSGSFPPAAWPRPAPRPSDSGAVPAARSLGLSLPPPGLAGFFQILLDAPAASDALPDVGAARASPGLSRGLPASAWPGTRPERRARGAVPEACRAGEASGFPGEGPACARAPASAANCPFCKKWPAY